MNCAILVQLDANAKVGKSVIPVDPNITSENGKLLLNLIERENLFLQNISPLCRGLITRQRSKWREIYFGLLDYLRNITWLSRKNGYWWCSNIFIKYASVKGKQKIVKSDHNVMFAYFDIQFQNMNFKKQRCEVFNLKKQRWK